jgi:hypothetical protein
MNVDINFIPGATQDSQGRCGHTDLILNGTTGEITGATIWMWQFQSNGVNCWDPATLTDLVAHEVGHVLGLNDVDWNTSCNGTIMGSSPSYVSSDQCGFVDQEWDEPGESDPNVLPPPDTDQCGFNGWVSACSPIVINLGTANYQLTGADSPVLFDISATGTPRWVGWTAPDTDQAFLWLDRDHNGKVDSGAELFGTATILRDGTTARNGYVALAEFDDNADGVIDSNDAIWPQLQLWFDFNHDGISQPEEIMPISLSRVRSIDLRYHWAGRRDVFGNLFRYESRVQLDERGHVVNRPIYDIYFVVVR